MTAIGIWSLWFHQSPWSACDRLNDVRRAVVGALAFANRSDMADRVLAGDGQAALEAATLPLDTLPVDPNSWDLTCIWLALHLNLPESDLRRARLALAGQMVVMRELGAPDGDRLATLATEVMTRKAHLAGRA